MPLLPSRKPRRGYFIDTPDSRDLNVDKLGLGSSALPETVSLNRFIQDILDQRNTNSCVAHAVALAIQIREAMQGDVALYPLISRLFLYYNSRYLHGSSLLDQGTYIRLCMKALERCGAPDEGLWTFSSSPLKVNRKPKLNAYMRGNGRKGGKYYRIYERGEQRALAVRAALAAGHPVVFGTVVDNAFLRSDGPQLVGLPSSDPVNWAGGHAMVLMGYNYVANDNSGMGAYEYDIANSWGTGWRIGGTAVITEEYLTWEMTSDLWIVDGWTNLREAA